MTLKERWIAGLIFRFYKTIYSTYRVEVLNPWWENPDIDPERPIVLAHWHEDDMALIGRYASLGFFVIVSLSKDGSLISSVLEKLGYKPIRGSSSRGGARALMNMIKALRQSNHVGVVTVDGPRGPRHAVKPGVIQLAQKTNAQIMTINAVARNRFVFKKSWSKTYLPMPFSRIIHYIGSTSLPLPQDDSNMEFERAMNQLENELKKNHEKLLQILNRKHS